MGWGNKAEGEGGGRTQNREGRRGETKEWRWWRTDREVNWRRSEGEGFIRQERRAVARTRASLPCVSGVLCAFPRCVWWRQKLSPLCQGVAVLSPVCR